MRDGSSPLNGDMRGGVQEPDGGVYLETELFIKGEDKCPMMGSCASYLLLLQYLVQDGKQVREGFARTRA